MKRLITFLTMLLLMVLIPDKCLAWTTVKFVSDDANLNGKELTKVNDNEFTYDLDLSESTSDLNFKFNVSDGCGDIGWYKADDNQGQEITKFDGKTQYWCANRTTNGQNEMFILKHSNSDYKKYKLTLKWGNTSNGIQYWNLTVEGSDAQIREYYLVVPNANVGNTNRVVPSSEFQAPSGYKAFRLKASRERNSTAQNYDLTSVALKIDDSQLRYNENDVIEFYIQSGDGTVYMQPTNNDNDISIKAINATNSNIAKNGVDYYAWRNGVSTTDSKRLYKIGRSNAKTLVFMFSRNNASKTAHVDNEKPNMPIANGNTIDGETASGYTVGRTGNLIVGFLMSRGVGSGYYNDHIKGSGDTENGVYLVGSIAQTAYTHNKSYLMTKRYWKGGSVVELSELEKGEADADSIVYDCLVRNSNRSWDDFFLAFSTGDVVEGEECWNRLLRPCVQDQMDAQELGGGVTFYKDDDGNRNSGQSINPLLTEEQKKRYLSYRVYFNATYSTYRIELYDGFYIAGPAVNNSTDTGNSGEFFDKDHRYVMTETSVNGVKHYSYTGKFKKGGTFAFLVNEETTAHNYSEDSNGLTDDGSESVWNVQAPGEGGDYTFYNKVKWNTDGGEDKQSLGTDNNAIVWTLPDGEYTLRFYYGDVNGLTDATDHPQALYTIDKKIKTTNITIECNGEKKNYNGWNGFSDDCALWLPSGIKAYYAYNVEDMDGKKIVKLRELKGGYIPAHCGVLLYNEKLTGENDVERLNYSPVPMDYTKDFSAYKTEYSVSDDNLLMDCSTSDKVVELDQQKEGFYNYYFTYIYNTNGERKNVPLNFWKVYPGSKPNKNSTYLHVSTQVTPLAFNVTDGNYYIEDASTVALNSKGAYCLLFSIDDVDDSEVTGIRVIRPAVNSEAGDTVWYNMQGMRVSKPTTAGIYINNGKKVIIK